MTGRAAKQFFGYDSLCVSHSQPWFRQKRNRNVSCLNQLHSDYSHQQATHQTTTTPPRMLQVMSHPHHPPHRHPQLPPPCSASSSSSSDNEDDVSMAVVASNESVLQHFQQGHVRLHSFALNKQATARDVLANKMVLLYMSASWCGPCKRFTPRLIQLYHQLKKEQENNHASTTTTTNATTTTNNNDFEIVFLSSDMLAGPYREYAASMPWWSLPLEESKIVDNLSAFYQTTGIPHLVVLDKEGTVLHQDAVKLVMERPATDFPWRPPRFVDLLPRYYVQQQQQQQHVRCNNESNPQEHYQTLSIPTTTGLDSKTYLLLYAGSHAHACCQKLTPQIAAVYRQLKAVRDDFEFLYLSSDGNQSDFDASLATLGCCAIPFEERQAAADIAALYDIQCVPTLVLLGPVPDKETCDRPVLNRHVRDLFWQDANDTAALANSFPFCPRAYGDLNQVSDNINELKCLVLLCEASDDEEQADMMEALQLASQDYRGCKPMRFYWACESTPLTKTLREALHIGPPQGPNMVLLDFASDASFYVAPCQDITVKSVLDFARQPGRVYKLS